MSDPQASVGRKIPSLGPTGLLQAAGAQVKELLALSGGHWGIPWAAPLRDCQLGEALPSSWQVDTLLFSSMHWVDEELGASIALGDT